MPKFFVATLVSVLSSFFLGSLPGFAHEGSGAEHLAMGIGIGEMLGLIVGIVIGAFSVFAFAKYKIQSLENDL